jgi:hypothetical protein
MNQGELMNINIAKNAICRQRICSSSSCSEQCSGSGGLGSTGAQGLIGSTGPWGGPPGDTGAQGLIGPPGPSNGPTGSTGPIGATGPSDGPKGDTGPQGLQGLQGVPGLSGSANIFTIKVQPASTNYNFANATVLTNGTDFGTYNGLNNFDGSSFSIALNSRYSITNMPIFIASAYAYNPSIVGGGYVNCQRQMGTHAGTAACQITVSTDIRSIYFNYLNKINFPSNGSDSAGFALYIYLQILN